MTPSEFREKYICELEPKKNYIYFQNPDGSLAWGAVATDYIPKEFLEWKTGLKILTEEEFYKEVLKKIRKENR